MSIVPRALTIAGSDSGGGAGIQADLKTFHQLGAYGMSVITVLTAQNTLGVQGVYPQSTECIVAQLRSVVSDIGVDAVKTGMLYSADIIEAVAEEASRIRRLQLVVDPVMIAKGGTPLLKQDAVNALIDRLLPLALVVTPNLPEACALLEIPEIHEAGEMEAVARRLHRLGPKYVLLKGGHLEGGDADDLLFDGERVVRFTTKRIRTKHTHGTGCTLSAAIAAELAKGTPVVEAVHIGKQFITAAIRESLAIGGGIGPTNHRAYRPPSEGAV